MKILCISQPSNKKCCFTGQPSAINEGEHYHTINERDDFYELAEHLGFLYRKNLFIPCSNIDETERIDEVLESMMQPVKS